MLIQPNELQLLQSVADLKAILTNPSHHASFPLQLGQPHRKNYNQGDKLFKSKIALSILAAFFFFDVLRKLQETGQG